MKKRAAEIREEEYLDQEDHNVNEGLDDGRVEELVKKEVMVLEDEQNNEGPALKYSPKSNEDNLELTLLPNSPSTQFPSCSCPSLNLVLFLCNIFSHAPNFCNLLASVSDLLQCHQGKRKRKPKQMHEEEIYRIKKKKKNTSAPNSKSAAYDLAGKNLSCKQENADEKVMSPTLIRTQAVRLILGPEAPCFAKVLVRSHVASCFLDGPSRTILQVPPTKDE